MGEYLSEYGLAIDRDQAEDYATNEGMGVETVEWWLVSKIGY